MCHNGSVKNARYKVCHKSISASGWHFFDILIVVELSWNRRFEGPAADALLHLHTISTYLTKPPSGSPSSYANCAPLVNSSGTGKSRMVDELSKRIITVPMCLRGHGTKGYVI
jgi:hypothetical protein